MCTGWTWMRIRLRFWFARTCSRRSVVASKNARIVTGWESLC
ncbi:hypothetical protein FHX37_4615 [Haloactinospora alba]|uniref:Uncharacterized protein n=1 Tax=Haloactinospora alba TaxID=405555 RepID=A0A543N2M0_9ACTN|nr:hypothetical protein FHX37_4615 [Haloactinospora alba]